MQHTLHGKEQPNDTQNYVIYSKRDKSIKDKKITHVNISGPSTLLKEYKCQTQRQNLPTEENKGEKQKQETETHLYRKV